MFRPNPHLGKEGYELEPVMMCTQLSIRSQLGEAMTALLDKEHFMVHTKDSVISSPSAFFTTANLRRQTALKAKKRPRVDVIVLTHTQMTGAWSNADDKGIFSSRRRYSAFFFDEAHVAKTPTTKVFRAAQSLAVLSHVKWAITATPIVNKPSDLITIFASIGFSIERGPRVEMPSLPPEFPVNLPKGPSAIRGFGHGHEFYKQLARIECAVEKARGEVQSECAKLRKRSGVGFFHSPAVSSSQQARSPTDI